MLKKILMAVAALIVIVIIIVVLVFRMTVGLTDVADEFFTAIGNDNIVEAYNTHLSEEFRAATSLEDLRLFLKQSTLAEFSEASWHNRSISNDQGELEGSITTTTGGTIPLTISFVKENNAWKILNISLAQAGLSAESSSLSPPPDDELRDLAKVSIHDLAVAINERDFDGFYDNIAALWQSQTTPDELMEIFTDFIDQQIDLTIVDDMQPVFDNPPNIDDDGMLRLTGYYPTQPSTTLFELGYLYEHPQWKLAAINIRVE